MKRILVVEDEPTILSAVVTRLRAEDFLVETAVDGPSAVATALETVPDLVVLDVMLPGFDGLEVCPSNPCGTSDTGADAHRSDRRNRHAARPRDGRRRLHHQTVQHAWGWTSEVESRTVDSHVKALRRKLGST